MTMALATTTKRNIDYKLLFEFVILNTGVSESYFNGPSVAMGVIEVSACIIFILFTSRTMPKLFGGKDESQGMVGMMGRGNISRSKFKW